MSEDETTLSEENPGVYAVSLRNHEGAAVIIDYFDNGTFDPEVRIYPDQETTEPHTTEVATGDLDGEAFSPEDSPEPEVHESDDDIVAISLSEDEPEAPIIIDYSGDAPAVRVYKHIGTRPALDVTVEEEPLTA